MNNLEELTGVAGDVVRDLLFFQNPTRQTCMPREEGEAVWLVDHGPIEDVLLELIEFVAAVNLIVLPEDWEGLVEPAIDDEEFGCLGCGAELNVGDEIGKNVEDQGTDLKHATHLLTHAYWPF